MNRINTFIILAVSVFLTLFVMYLFVNERVQREPDAVMAPLKIEAYRVDRFPLPDADIYLNQRFIGKTDGKGFFLKDVNLLVGESYTLRIEKDRDGYVYGPWETNFRVAAEKKRRREKKEEEAEEFPSLEGEFDVLAEIQRAELGRVSLFEKYHFLAIVDGYMYYTVRVMGNNEVPVFGASITVNGKLEGSTDEDGYFVVKYSGEDVRAEGIQVFKDGEHIWQKSVDVRPSDVMLVELNKMLLVDLYAYTESYDVIEGIGGTVVYMNDQLVGTTGRSGYFGYRYENQEGVDGYLEVRLEFPGGYSPERQVKSFLISTDLPRLTHTVFSYPTRAVPPRVSVLPLRLRDRGDVLLSRRAYDLKRSIEDYLSLESTFTVVSDRQITELFDQFEVDIGQSGANWSGIPFLKNRVDSIIYGELGTERNYFTIKLTGIDYTGNTIGQVDSLVGLRDLNRVPESFVDQFRRNFPFEGTIAAVDRHITINLGDRHGIEPDDKFHSFFNYYDEIKRDYSRKRVAKLRVTEVDRNQAVGELESISEGYLLEPGGKVKRFSEPVQALRRYPITVTVTSGRNGLPGANVYLDDQWAGQTGDEGTLQIVMAESTTADILVYREGYIPEKIEIRVQDGENNFRVNLKQGRTQFTIDSEPRGALLFINGEFKGNTPLVKKSLDLPYGFHRIELKLDGYKDYNQYVKFSQRRISLTGKDRVVLFKDLYRKAEEAYEKEKYDRTLRILESVPETHPDFARSMEFCGYIYMRHFRDYETSITCYSRAIDHRETEYGSSGSVITYYNYGQACYSRAEELYYDNSVQSQVYFRRAIEAFDVVRKGKAKVQSTGRRNMYQEVLFYAAVSYQKLYYLTGLSEYLSKAHYAWIDYFDFFDNNLLEDSFFENQYRIAESYREEVKRLRGEN
jgi:hypothetical protein